MIFVTLHMGHWELLGGAVSELVAPLHAVMKPLRNPYLNEAVVARRAAFGLAPLAKKNVVPEGPGTLPTHGPLFVSLLVGVVVLVGALTFLPGLALGPIVEHLRMGG